VLGNEPISDGIDRNRFDDKYRSRKFVNKPISVGIDFNLLLQAKTNRKFINFVIP
jgi:hypothetical protein